MAKSVAIIGGGAAGIIAARVFNAQGFCVTGFESSRSLGGVWNFSETTGNVYDSLRTNLPRTIMSFSEQEISADLNFPGASAVSEYLHSFSSQNGVDQLFNMGCQVMKVVPHDVADRFCKWTVSWKNESAENFEKDFDAVCVCNGHYNKPFIPTRIIPGLEQGFFKGKQLHSKQYRRPGPFKDLKVVVVGAAASGAEICREVAECASQVFLSTRSKSGFQTPISAGPEGQSIIIQVPEIQQILPSGSIQFKNDEILHDIDCIIWATGYRYEFKFLDPHLCVSAQESSEGPLSQTALEQPEIPMFHLTENDKAISYLWKDMVHPCFLTMPFIGIPFKVVPFPLFELQSVWAAKMLKGEISIPSKSDMFKSIHEYLHDREVVKSIPIRYRHMSGDSQWQYRTDLMEEIGCLPEAFQALQRERVVYEATSAGRAKSLQLYRDNPYDEIGGVKVDKIRL